MKKLFDRRMCGFILCIFVLILILVAICLAPHEVVPSVVAVTPLVIGGLITLLGILITGNVIDNKTTPKEPNVG